jgi:hypothetical protein
MMEEKGGPGYAVDGFQACENQFQCPRIFPRRRLAIETATQDGAQKVDVGFGGGGRERVNVHPRSPALCGALKAPDSAPVRTRMANKLVCVAARRESAV